MRYYTVYLRKTDEVIASGDARSCSRVLGCRSVYAFYSMVSKTRRGIRKKYDILIDDSDDDEDYDDLKPGL